MVRCAHITTNRFHYAGPVTKALYEMKKYPVLKKEFPFPVYTLEVKSLLEIYDVDFPSRYFTLLLTANYSDVNTIEFAELSKTLIGRGLRYACSWGRESTLGDNGFDLGNILRQEENQSDLHIMTTWHDESVADAIWFWLYNAYPDDEFWPECSSILVNVSNEACSNEVHKMLSDIEYLNKSASSV